MPANLPLAAIVFVVTMVVSGLCTELVRRRVVALNMGQQVREDGPQSHLAKTGTPALGGIGFMAALTLVTLGLWALRPGLVTFPVLMALLLALAYGGIGFADDYSKLRYKRSLGLKARARLPLEFLLAGVFAWLLTMSGSLDGQPGPAQIIPFGSGVLFIALAMFVIAGVGNAVNLTDGLDGLAGGSGLLCALGLAGACVLLGRLDLALFGVVLAGAMAGFLWLNAHPARIFMGDTGSLALGGALGTIAVAARLELMLGVFGLLFVWEACSVILQVLYFRSTGGKRLFRMAPYHHHLELRGMPETQIVIRAWLLGLALAAVGIGLVAVLVRGAA